MSKHIRVQHNGLQKKRQRWQKKIQLLNSTLVTTITQARKIWNKTPIEVRRAGLEKLDAHP